MNKPKVLRNFDFQGKTKVNINVIRPIGYLYSEAFREAAEAISRDAWEAGIDYIISENFIAEDRHNILLGAHLTCLNNNADTKKYQQATVINLERLNCFSQTWGKQAFVNYCDLLRKSTIIDYCQTNNNYLKECIGKDAGFLYRPWHDARWQKVPNLITKEHDICMIGSLTNRRKDVIREMENRGLNVYKGKGLFSTERDQALAKAKIVLNIHAYENSTDIELWRINYLASNGLYVLSETSAFEEGENEIEQQIITAPLDQIVDKAEELVQQYDLQKANENGRLLQEAAIRIQTKDLGSKATVLKPKKRLEKLHLNLSCGQTYYEDALNVDTDKNSRADIAMDIGDNWENIEGIHTLSDKTEATLHATQFDVINANDILHTTNNLRQTLSNICRLLKPGGVVYFQGPYLGSRDAWANPKTKREINEEIIPYLNEWSKSTNLGDAKLSPIYINISTNNKVNRVSFTEEGTLKTIDACFAKKIDTRGPDGNSFHDFHRKNLGTLSLSEKTHRKILINSSKDSIEDWGETFEPSVSILTPTMSSRFSTLPLLWEWIIRQNYPHDKIQWIIGTDNEEEQKFLQNKLDAGTSRGINIKIKSTNSKLPVGAKRNCCNHWADGEILVNMDDDDYYFPQRIAHSVEKLRSCELCASQQLPMYFLDDRTMWISDPGQGFACAGSFAYRKSILNKTWYGEKAINGEEISFTDFYEMNFTELDPFSTMICIAHTNNTFSKHELRDKAAKESWISNAKKTVTGTKSFYKVEGSADDYAQSDWRSWYEYAFNKKEETLSKPNRFPELFRENETTLLGKFAESAIKLITSKN